MTSTAVDLCAIPAAIPPNGKSNFVNPITLAPVLLSIGITLATITTIFTIGRTYMNRRTLREAEYTALSACIINIAFTGVVLAQSKYARHQWDTPVCLFNGSTFKLAFAQTILIAPIFITSKAAIFLLYRQIFAIERRMKIAIKLGLFVTILLYLPNIPLAAIFNAPHPGSSWASMLTSPRSIKTIYWGILQSALSVLLDLYIFVLPLPIVAKLNMSLRRRLQIIGIFTTALMGVIASVLSLVYRIKLFRTKDESWSESIVSICIMVEINVAIIVSCMPAFAQLLKVHVGGSALFQSLRSRFLGGSSSNPSGDGSNVKERPQHATFGSNQSPRRKNYYELSDNTLLKSQVTVDSGPEATSLGQDGIVRSVGFSQQSQHSTECLA